MKPVLQEERNANFSSIYTPDIYFDDWVPCITVPWSRIYNDNLRKLQPEWEHLDKKISPNFAFPIPEKAIHGLLFIDGGKCFFRDHHKGRLSQLRIRNCLKGMNILGAFWVPHQQLIIVHDIYMKESMSVCEEMFTSRWQLLAKAIAFIENDPSLQGFTLTIVKSISDEDAGEISANFRPINEDSGSATSGGVILQPNVGLATVIYGIPIEKHTPSQKNNEREHRNTIIKTTNLHADATTIKEINNAYITKHSKFNGPESFQLWSMETNEDYGMPCIQSLKLIQLVRNKLKECDKCIVEIKWNKNLNSYEVVSIKE